jgi:hypothetical protein
VTERLKILLSGMVAGNPHQGGATWAVFQYLESLTELGHDVVLVEPLKGGCGEPGALQAGGDVLDYFHSLRSLDGRGALFVEGTERTAGLPFERIAKFAAEADVVLNLSGTLHDPRLLEPAPVRAYVDLDPGFTQVWHLSGEDMGFDRHTHFVTVGLGIGDKSCPIPSCGRHWITTVPPVALGHWPVTKRGRTDAAFTTVGHWRSYGSIEHEGIHYGQRAHSFRQLMSLPGMTDVCIQVALGIHPDETADIEALSAGNWELLDPLEVAGTPGAYREFIRRSQAELCIAKSGYVASRSGWISDRSACYLASGRPVVAQNTGLKSFFPTGQGLLTFEDSADAAEAIDEVARSWELHSGAARCLAEEYLDGRKVLTRLLGQLGAGPVRSKYS